MRLYLLEIRLLINKLLGSSQPESSINSAPSTAGAEMGSRDGPVNMQPGDSNPLNATTMETNSERGIPQEVYFVK